MADQIKRFNKKFERKTRKKQVNFLSPTIVERGKKKLSTKPEGILNIIICSLFKTRELNRAIYREITDCYSFSPKAMAQSFSQLFFFFHFLLSSSLAIELISCQAKYIYRTLFLSFEHTKITSISEFCNVRCQALLQNQLRHVLPFYVGNNYHTFMFRLKLLLCLFKKKRRCNLKIKYSCFLCLLLELPEMSLFCFICFLAWELNPFCL